ncbi:MAG: 1,4-alpha-glucan branching protein GlgB [Defluviitaleaceae bacterium]|nr:1,4-alpha-glucan branching protein GlgB [Defluviitaleaceae bacterium]
MTANAHELMKIVEGSHGDPHHILGLHHVPLDSKMVKVIRVFNPEATSVEVFVPNSPEKRVEMDKIHNIGFFEATWPDKYGDEYMLDFCAYSGDRWQSYDPYSFGPVLTDLDLHLFGNGTHYEIFNKLGAHPMTVDGVAGVHFAVWAPNARRVSVVGDFNSWHGLRHPMRILQRSGIWEIFIPGIGAGDNYKFEVKALNNNIQLKSDPYSNFNELRPGSASIVYDIDRYKWQDEKWFVSRDNKDPLAGPINIYEVHLGSWQRGDDGRFLTYVELANKLVPYVKKMGYTHVELMPATEYPFDGSWGYQVTGYFAPTSRYGTPDEFMALVDAFHQNDIGVFMDWVPAHFPKDAHGLAYFDGTALYEHQDPRMGEHPEWGTLIFNYGRKEVMNFLIANALFWIEKYHIDGLRVDAVASMLYLDYGKNEGQWVSNAYGGRENIDAVEFIKHMNSIIREKHPNVLMMAEESTEWGGVTKLTKDGGLGFSLKWNMGWMNDFLSYMCKDSVYRKYHHNQLTFAMMYNHSERFLLVLSHDEVVHGKGALINKMPGDVWQKMANLRGAYAFMMGHPGKKLLFMGGELAQFEEWSEAKSLNWFLLDQYEHHQQMQSYVRDLNKMYLNEKALWHNEDQGFGGGFEWINPNDWEHSIFTFFRRAPKMHNDKPVLTPEGNEVQEILVFVCNFTPSPWTAHRIGVPIAGVYKEIINSDEHKYGGSGIINPEPKFSEDIHWDNRPYSIEVAIPPLGVTVLKLQE